MKAAPAPLVEQPNLWEGAPAAVRREAPPSEIDKREKVLGNMEQLRRDLIGQVRLSMTDLYRARAHTVALHGHWYGPEGELERRPWVSADDARAAFEKLFPPPGINRNCLGTVFRVGGWSAIAPRRVLSKTPGSHANELKMWILTEPKPKGTA